MELQDKQRIIQEFVPGKQVTLAHVIANPDEDLYQKLGVVGEHDGALGIMTITPGEGVIIAADLAGKSACVRLVFVDRFSGALVFRGTVTDVEAALTSIMSAMSDKLRFTPTEVTKT